MTVGDPGCRLARTENPRVGGSIPPLATILESGPLATIDLQKRATQAGLSWATVRRANDALGVKARKSGMEGGWTWELSAKEPEGER